MTFDIDSQIIKRLSDGDQGAFRVVFEHYYPRVSEFVRRIVKDDNLAEDITQDIFVKIWERREIFGVEVQAFGKYIYVMSRNAAINALRRSGRVSSLSNELLNKSDNDSVEESYYAQEKELIIRLAVCQMPEQRRRIFEMSRYMGMDNQTIATTLNLSKKTVENHLTLALKTLRSILAVWASLFLIGGGFCSKNLPDFQTKKIQFCSIIITPRLALFFCYFPLF